MSLGTETIRRCHDFTDMVLEESSFGGNADATELMTAQGFSRPSDDGSMTSLREKTRKSVRFQNVTMYSFGRLQGFSCIPSQDGPTLGMGYKHTFVETYDIVDNLELSNACAQTEITGNLQSNGCVTEDTCEIATARLRQRTHNGCVQQKEKRVVGITMQPLSQRERRRLLLAAGVTIDKMEAKESKTVRDSRMFCGCLCQVICIPDSCSCCLSEIPCQVDRDSFPCGCSLNGCANPVGRNQFDRSKVHLHRLMRLSQVDKTLDRKVAMTEALDLWLVASPSKYPKLTFGKQDFNRNYPRKRMPKKKMLLNEPVDAVVVVAKSSVGEEKNCDEVIDTMNSAFSFQDDVVKFTDNGSSNVTDFAGGEKAERSDFFSVRTDDSDVMCESQSTFRLQALSSANDGTINAQICKGLETETLTFSSIPNGDSKEIPGRSVDLETESDCCGCYDLKSLCPSVAKDCAGSRSSVVSEDGSLSLVDKRWSIADVSPGLVECDVVFDGFILPTYCLDLRKNGMSSSTPNVSSPVMEVETPDSKAESCISAHETLGRVD